MTLEELNEMEARLHRITLGEWKSAIGRNKPLRVDIVCGDIIICHSHAVSKEDDVNPNYKADFDFMIHAPNDMQKLIDEIRENKFK